MLHPLRHDSSLMKAKCDCCYATRKSRFPLLQIPGLPPPAPPSSTIAIWRLETRSCFQTPVHKRCMRLGQDSHPARSFRLEVSATADTSSITRAREKHIESCSRRSIEATRKPCPYRLECSQGYGNDRL